MIYAVRKENESNEKLILKRKQREKAIITNHYRELNSKVYF